MVNGTEWVRGNEGTRERGEGPGHTVRSNSLSEELSRFGKNSRASDVRRSTCHRQSDLDRAAIRTLRVGPPQIPHMHWRLDVNAYSALSNVHLSIFYYHSHAPLVVRRRRRRRFLHGSTGSRPGSQALRLKLRVPGPRPPSAARGSPRAHYGTSAFTIR